MEDDADRPRQSSNSSGIVALLVALPLLYALSMGPAAFFFSKYPTLKPMEDAAQAFYAPMFWLHQHTSLKEPIENYVGWWERRGRT